MIIPRSIIYDISFRPPGGIGAAYSDVAFRDGFAALLGGGSEIVPLGRARTGLYLVVKNIVREGRRKIVLSPYTLPDVVNLVRFGGGQPVFVDFLPNSTNIDVRQLANLIDAETAGVLVTHYHVNQKDLRAISDLCRDRGVLLFDDCAISLGAQYEGRPIGSLVDASVFSMSGFKILNYFWGGALALPAGPLAAAIEREVSIWPPLASAKYWPQIRKIAAFAAVTSPTLFPLVFRLRRRQIAAGRIVDMFPVSRIESVALDETLLSRPSSAALAEWVGKFGSVETIVCHRRAIAAVYDDYFRNINVSAETPEALRRESAFVNYPIVVGEQRRNHLYRETLEAGFDVGLSLYPNAHETQSFHAVPGRTENVSRLVRSILTLPTHTRMTPEHARKLSQFLAAQLASGRKTAPIAGEPTQRRYASQISPAHNLARSVGDSVNDRSPS